MSKPCVEGFFRGDLLFFWCSTSASLSMPASDVGSRSPVSQPCILGQSRRSCITGGCTDSRHPLGLSTCPIFDTYSWQFPALLLVSKEPSRWLAMYDQLGCMGFNWRLIMKISSGFFSGFKAIVYFVHELQHRGFPKTFSLAPTWSLGLGNNQAPAAHEYALFRSTVQGTIDE